MVIRQHGDVILALGDERAGSKLILIAAVPGAAGEPGVAHAIVDGVVGDLAKTKGRNCDHGDRRS